MTEIKKDDAIREVHGVRCYMADASHRNQIRFEENEDYIMVVLGVEKAKLTRWQARYLAAKLYRVSRRITARMQETDDGE